VGGDPVGQLDPKGLDFITAAAMAAWIASTAPNTSVTVYGGSGGSIWITAYWSAMELELWANPADSFAYISEEADEKKRKKGDERNRRGVECDSRVIQAMTQAWMGSSNGRSNTEAGFVLTGSPENFQIVALPRTNQDARITFRLPENTFAIFHTHPTVKDPKPSTQDQRLANSRQITMFVGSSTGLYQYNPGGTNNLLAENLDWLSKCD
jgi:hypothetical protein